MYRVLVADDDADMRALLLMMILREGHEVVAVPDGATALLELESGGYDLAVLERDLVGASGSDGLWSLVAEERSFPPVVMVSSPMSPPEVREALSRGVALHLTKPFTRLELLAAVTSLLEGAEDDEESSEG